MALIIRPNGGINNAMAGLAAGLTQGMQLGLEAEKIAIERERRQAEAARAEQAAALALAQEGRQQALFQQGMDERAAAKQAMGYLADAQGAVDKAEQGFAGQRSTAFGPIQSDMETGAPMYSNAARDINGWLGGMANRAAYQGVAAKYKKSMDAASLLASKMDPQMAQFYLGEKQRMNLRMADQEARNSFGSQVADMRMRGAFRVLGPQGQEVDDPQMESSIQMLLEQASNENVPLQQTQSALDGILKQVSVNNVKARDFQFQMTRIDQGMAKALEGQNQGVLKALQELKQFAAHNPYATPEQLSTRYEAAMSGRVERTMPDGKTTVMVNATNADKEYEQEVAKFNELDNLRLENARLQKQLGEAGLATAKEQPGLIRAQAGYWGRRDTGMTPYQASSVAAREWSAMGDEGQAAIMDRGITAEEWMRQRAAELSRGLDGGGYAFPTAAGGSAARPSRLAVPTSQQQEEVRRILDANKITDPQAREKAALEILNGTFGKANVRPQFRPIVPGEGAPPAPPAAATTEILRASEQALGLNEFLGSLKPKSAKSLGEYRQEISDIDFNTIKNEADANRAIERVKDIDKIYKVGAGNVVQYLEDMKRSGNYPSQAMTLEQLKAKRQSQYERGYAQGKTQAPAIAEVQKAIEKSGSSAQSFEKAGPAAPSSELRQEQQAREAAFAKYAKRISSMSDQQLKDEIVAAYGFDIRDIAATMREMGFDDTKYTLLDIAGAAPQILSLERRAPNVPQLSRQYKTAEGQPFSGEDVPANLRPIHAAVQQLRYKDAVQARTTTLPPRVK